MKGRTISIVAVVLILDVALASALSTGGVRAFSSPLKSPLPSPTAPCSDLVFLTEKEDTITAEWRIKRGHSWQPCMDVPEGAECYSIFLAPSGNTLRRCQWDVIQESPASPEPSPAQLAPKPAAHQWIVVVDADGEPALWMGAYTLIVNERGEYCIPDLGPCER